MSVENLNRTPITACLLGFWLLACHPPEDADAPGSAVSEMQSYDPLAGRGGSAERARGELV